MSTKKRGFASMSESEKKELQSKGSKSSHGGGRKTGGHSGGSSKRGFAAMDPAEQKRIASKGGHASHGGGRPSGS